MYTTSKKRKKNLNFPKINHYFVNISLGTPQTIDQASNISPSPRTVSQSVELTD